MSEDFFRKICTSHFIVTFVCERELKTEQRLQYIDPHSYGRQRCVFLVLQSCSTGGPGAQLSTGLWLSLLHLTTNWSPNTIGGPEGPFGRVWLSLPHLVSDVSDPPLIRGSKAPSAGLSLPHLISNFYGPQLIRGSKGPLHRAFSTTSYRQLLWTPTI